MSEVYIGIETHKKSNKLAYALGASLFPVRAVPAEPVLQSKSSCVNWIHAYAEGHLSQVALLCAHTAFIPESGGKPEDRDYWNKHNN